MRSFTISIPEGTYIFDRYGPGREERDLEIHIIAESEENALELVAAAYATHVGDDSIKTFQPRTGMPAGNDFVEILGRASDFCGTIKIEGGLVLQTAESLQMVIKASEGEKVRWIHFDPESKISPWAIVERLQQIF